MPPSPSIELRRFARPDAFLDAAGLFLLRHEVERPVLLGVAFGLLRQLAFSVHEPYLASVERDGDVVAAALMTPPFNFSRSLSAEPAPVDLFASDLSRWRAPPPGVVGPAAGAKHFAARWHETTGQPIRAGMRQRLHRLERVRPVSGVPGALRRASETDRDLLLSWMGAFTREALGQTDPSRTARAVDLRLGDEESNIFTWEDGEPGSMVGYANPTPNSVRIAPVSTPPDRRNRGYGAAATAAASQALLDEGRRFCCLFTDLANPASNPVYDKVGHEPILDVDEYRFVP